MADINDYLTVPEVARLLKVDRSTVLDAIYKGRLAARKKGRNWLMLMDDVRRWANDPESHIRGTRPPKRGEGRSVVKDTSKYVLSIDGDEQK